MSKIKSILKTVCIGAVSLTSGYMCARILTKKLIDERIYKKGFRDGSLSSDRFWKELCDTYDDLCTDWRETYVKSTEYWKGKYTELLKKEDEES